MKIIFIHFAYSTGCQLVVVNASGDTVNFFRRQTYLPSMNERDNIYFKYGATHIPGPYLNIIGKRMPQGTVVKRAYLVEGETAATQSASYYVTCCIKFSQWLIFNFLQSNQL